jgi:hypothetical protein
MTVEISQELAGLPRLSTKQLRARYGEAHGEQTCCGNRAWLVKRIAWRLQMLAEGDLSERAQRRAEELANDADLRLGPPRVLPPAARPVLTDPPAATTMALPSEATQAAQVSDACSAHAKRPAATASATASPADERLPAPGAILTRRYKGQTLQIKVLPEGFEFAGQAFQSLSAVAKAITGSHCNGFLFFRLGKYGAKR